MGGSDSDGFMPHRMVKHNLISMERDAAIGVGAWGSILEISFDGAAHVGKLAPDLVMTTRVELNFEQMIAALGGGKKCIIQRGKLCLGVRGVGSDEAFVKLGIAEKIILQMARRTGGCLRYNSTIDLAKIALFDELIHAAECLAGFSKEDHPADGTVQSMNNTAENVAGLGITLLDVGLKKVGKAEVAGLVGLDNLSRQLVEGYQVVVFVQYLLGK